MKNALKELTPEQIKFICEECGIEEDALFEMNDDDIYDKVYDVMCDIECAETPVDDTPITDRCQMASDIVTVLGEAL